MISVILKLWCALSIIFTINGEKPPLDEFISGIFDTFCGPNHVCVRHHQCKDGKINSFGAKIIQPRIGEPPKESNAIASNCSHYLETCCFLPNRQTHTNVKVFIPQQERSGCGYRNAQGVALRIMDEDETVTEFAEFPWMMAIMKDNKYMCGGALISESVVLTVAHYVHNEPPYSLIVRAGEWDTQTINEPLSHEERIVIRIIVHEEYRNEDENLFFDIALLFLDRPLNLKPNIQPICLPEPSTNFDNLPCFVTGWGKDKYGHEGQRAVILKKIQIPIIPRAKCESQFRATAVLGRYFDLHHSFICAGGEEGRDACEGDGGSPLVCPIPGQSNRYQLAGLVAWGLDCGQKDVPGAYVNVAGLRPWINEKLGLGGVDGSLLENVNDASTKNPSEVSKPNTAPNPQANIVDNGCAANEVCVRPLQCLNGKFNRDGRKILQPRIADKDTNVTVVGKCEHYLDRCCDIGDFKKVQKTVEEVIESDGCGYRKDILFPPQNVSRSGAYLSSFAEFPWMLAILNNDMFLCSGVLLSENVVLTLTSCVFKYEPKVLMVRAGEWDTQTVKEPLPHEMRRTLKIIDHNDFDIALLILTRPFELASHINPICLPKSEDNFNYDECLLTGWGKFNNVDDIFNILQYSNWRLSPNKPCQMAVNEENERKCWNLNFINMENNAKACSSTDVGSPLICKVPNTSNRYQLAGVMVECGLDGTQSADFISVPFFNTWLAEKIGGWFNTTLIIDVRRVTNSSP